MALPYILRPIHDDNSAAFIGGLDDYAFVSNQLSESLRLLGEEVSGGRVDPKGVSVVQEVITDQTRHLNRDILIWRNPRRLVSKGCFLRRGVISKVNSEFNPTVILLQIRADLLVKLTGVYVGRRDERESFVKKGKLRRGQSERRREIYNGAAPSRRV